MLGLLCTLVGAAGCLHEKNKYDFDYSQKMKYAQEHGKPTFLDSRGILRNAKNGNMAYHKGGCVYDSKTGLLIFDPKAEKRKREEDTRRAFLEVTDYIPMKLLSGYRYYRKGNYESVYYLYKVETSIGNRYYYIKSFDKYVDFKKGQLVATANMQMIDDMKSGRGCQKEFDKNLMEEFNSTKHIIKDVYKEFKVSGGFVDTFNLDDINIPLEDIKYITMWKNGEEC